MRRRARLQRVEEEVRRRVVVGFFDTLYHSRKFKRYLELKKTARMTYVPKLDVPDIFVDDEEERAENKKPKNLSPTWGPLSPGTPGSAPLHSPSTFLSPTRSSAGHQKTFSNMSTDLTLQTNFDSSGAHPLSMPRMSGGEAGLSSQPGRGGGVDGHQSTHSAFSFELQDPGSGQNSRRSSNRNSRSNSAVSPIQMSQILDDSIWMASIRRSATMKRKPSQW